MYDSNSNLWYVENIQCRLPPLRPPPISIATAAQKTDTVAQILHIQTASLHHAAPILASAINAGFRESGIQSLNNLDDANTFPMVAIRSAGLAFESLVAHLDEGGEVVRNLVSDGYLRLLLRMANERFKANAERTCRFQEDLFRREGPRPGWEDAESRQARKKAEGLERRRLLRMERTD